MSLTGRAPPAAHTWHRGGFAPRGGGRGAARGGARGGLGGGARGGAKEKKLDEVCVCVCVCARARMRVYMNAFQLDLSQCKLAFGCVMHACD